MASLRASYEYYLDPSFDPYDYTGYWMDQSQRIGMDQNSRRSWQQEDDAQCI